MSNKTEAPAGALQKASEIKTFILDTNIPLQDPTCLTRFQEHNVAIPFPVIEELDKVKMGTQPKTSMPENLHAIWKSLQKTIIQKPTPTFL